MRKYLALLFLTACSGVEVADNPAQLQQEWEEMYMVGSAKRLAEMYTTDATVVDTETISGNAAIHQTLKEHLDRYRVVFDEDVTLVVQNGEVIHTTRFTRRLTEKDGQEVHVDQGQREITYVKTPQGWRISREVWQ